MNKSRQKLKKGLNKAKIQTFMMDGGSRRWEYVEGNRRWVDNGGEADDSGIVENGKVEMI